MRLKTCLIFFPTIRSGPLGIGYTQYAVLTDKIRLTEIVTRPDKYLKAPSREALDEWIEADKIAWRNVQAGVQRPSAVRGR